MPESKTRPARRSYFHPERSARAGASGTVTRSVIELSTPRKQRGARLQGPPLEPVEAMGCLKSENLRPTATSLVGRQILVATVRDSAKALERRPLQMQRRKGSLLFRRLSLSVVTPFISGLARRGGLISVLALAHGVSPHSQCKRSNDVDQWRFRLPRQQMIIRKLDHEWQPATGELCLRRT
jgi:hypothetical protein